MSPPHSVSFSCKPLPGLLEHVSTGAQQSEARPQPPTAQPLPILLAKGPRERPLLQLPKGPFGHIGCLLLKETENEGPVIPRGLLRGEPSPAGDCTPRSAVPLEHGGGLHSPEVWSFPKFRWPSFRAQEEYVLGLLSEDRGPSYDGKSPSLKEWLPALRTNRGEVEP